MRDFLDLLSIDQATVVGQSFGGGVALQFAYQSSAASAWCSSMPGAWAAR